MVGGGEEVRRQGGVNMDAVVETKAETGWQHDLYDLLRRNGITQF